MNETYAVYVIRLAKEATRGAALGLFATSVIMAFIFVLATYPDEIVIDVISNIMTGSILMLIAHIILQVLYRSAKDKVEETTKEPEEIDEESDT